MEYRVNKYCFINILDTPIGEICSNDIGGRLNCITGKFKSNKMAKLSDIRKLWVGEEINSESDKIKLIVVPLVEKQIYIVTWSTNI